MMASSYYQNLIKRVLEASTTDNWEIAVREWDIVDCEEDEEHASECVCGKENLRYLFTIRNMDYVRISKSPCMNEIGKKKYGFDYDKALLEYKYFVGEKMSRKEWEKLKDCKKCNSYFEWEKSVMNENKEKTKIQLTEFEHYLDNKISMLKPQKNVYTILCSALLGAIATYLCDHINHFFNLENDYQFTLFIVIIIIFPFLIIFAVWIMCKVMLPLWSTNTESTFLNEYRKIIKRMLDK